METKDEAPKSDYVLFWKPPHFGSQWTHSVFEIDDVRYTCAEQYMMAEKAKLFGDANAKAKIMSTTSPCTMRAWGRKVVGFDQDVWETKCQDVVLQGNLAKFRQNPNLAKKLLATGNRVMAEASPYDKVWGIGLDANDPRAHNHLKWKGRNLLGIALMKVRTALQKEAKKTKPTSDDNEPTKKQRCD